MPIIHSSPPQTPEFIMLQSLSQRALSLSFAVVVTLGMLGGINLLSQADSQPAQWAQKVSAPRA
jgi:hypothetical protein